MSSELGFRDRIARSGVLVTNLAARATGLGSGTVLGGRVGLAISPRLLEALSRGREVILVSGTNGKTTTTSMAAAGWGGVATNETGANMIQGHVAAMVASASTNVVLEVDEAWLPSTLLATRAKVVVLTNLSRDQLDRANEVRQLAGRWRRALSVEDAQFTVVANANDPLVAFAAMGARRVVWCDVPTTWMADAASCPVCTRVIKHSDDSWRCVCGFERPSTPETTLDMTTGRELRIDGQRVDLALSIPGEFNRSNAALALSALRLVGVDLEVAVARVNAISSVAGRFSLRHWDRHVVRLLLAKNPAGFDALLSTVPRDDSPVWIAINARLADGHDPSWLYDVPFEALRGHKVYCFGDRRLDLATRLNYANVECEVVDHETTLPVSDSPVPLMANYTAFSDWMARTTS